MVENCKGNIVLFPINYNIISSVIGLFTDTLLQYIDIGGDYVIIPTNHVFIFKNWSVSYQPHNIKNNLTQILEIKRELGERIFMFRIYSNRISFSSQGSLDFPDKLNNLIKITGSDNNKYFEYTIPENKII